MLKFENPTNGRYYYIIKNKDMINDLAITVIRGGIHHNVTRRMGYNDPGQLEREVEKLVKRRIKRGYVLVS